jgi:hypothetical protein
MPRPTIDEIIAAAESRQELGFCVACGAMASDVEPDAREYFCEKCGRLTVYGAEELLLCGDDLLDDEGGA